MPQNARVSPDPRVMIIDDYAFTLCVRRGHVICKANGSERVISRLNAAKTRDGIARIIILSHVGTVSMEVLRWASALDVTICQVSRDGSVGFISPGATSQDARIAVRQVTAGTGMPDEKRGIELARNLIGGKIAGQHENMTDILKVDIAPVTLDSVHDVRRMLSLEGSIAVKYWNAWRGRVYAPWEPSALKYVPGHWSQFNGRATIRTVGNGYSASSNRQATDFINACLNYAYRIAETEAMHACHVFGLHPGIGIMHGTHNGKQGMALDLLEPLRPITDRVVLSYMDCGNGIPFGDDGKPAYISEKCAVELEDGTCRLFPPMTDRLATAVSMAVAPYAMQYAATVVKLLAPDISVMKRVPRDMRIKLRQ